MKYFKLLIRKFIRVLFLPIFNVCEQESIEKNRHLIIKSLKHSGNNVLFDARNSFFNGLEYISIGNNFSVGRGFRLEAINTNNKQQTTIISIGNDCNIEFNCHIGACHNISIGNGVLIASNVYITDHFHGTISDDEIDIRPALRKISSKGCVVIEDNVWIGEYACILPGVTIGKGCIIGAHTVVTKSLPPFSVAAGVPAKIIKKLV